MRAFAGWSATLLHGWLGLQKTIAVLRGAEQPRARKNATAFLPAFWHLVVAWIWLDLALEAVTVETGDPAFAAGKQRACRYYRECELPYPLVWLSLARSLSDAAAGMPVKTF